MTFFTSDRLQTSLWLGLGLLLVVLLVVLAPVLTPFAFAAILAYLMSPGVEWLVRHRTPRWAAALGIMLVAFLILFALLLILVPVLRNEAVALQEQLPGVVARLNDVVAPRLLDWFGVHVRFDAQTLRDLLAEQAGASQDLAAKVFASVRAGGLALVGVLGLLVLVPVVLFYLLVDGQTFLQLLENTIPRRWHARTVHMLNEIDQLLALFLRGQLAVMLVLAAYYSIALAIAGFDTALPIGILTGLLVFIPYVGFTLGLLLAALAALLQFGPAYGLGAVALIYGVGQFIESFVLTPRLVGERIGMHPLGVIFALLAFGQVFGFLGVLLALPVSAALLVALRHVGSAYLASDFYNRV